MPEWVLQTYYIILPILVSSLMGWVGYNLKKSQKKQDELEVIRKKDLEAQNLKREANAQGTKLILFYMLQRLHVEYMYQGYVTHEQRTQYRELYEAYHGLGGNGYGTRMWEDIKELDIRNDKEGVSPFIRILKGELPEKKESD